MTAASDGLVADGALVHLEWSVRLDRTGERLVDAASDKAAFDEGAVRLVVGGGGYLPALHRVAKELEGVGEAKTFVVSPYDAFGERSADLGPVELPISSAPEGLKISDMVQLSNGLKARVTAMTDELVTIDANPALAGEALQITAKLLAAPVRGADLV